VRRQRGEANTRERYGRGGARARCGVGLGVRALPGGAGRGGGRTGCGVVAAGARVPVEAQRDAEPRLRTPSPPRASAPAGGDSGLRCAGDGGGGACVRGRGRGDLDSVLAVLASLAFGAAGVVGVPSVEIVVKLGLGRPEFAVLCVWAGFFGAVIFGAILAIQAKEEIAVIFAHLRLHVCDIPAKENTLCRHLETNRARSRHCIARGDGVTITIMLFITMLLGI
jgi:hypothetical protein